MANQDAPGEGEELSALSLPVAVDAVIREAIPVASTGEDEFAELDLLDFDVHDFINRRFPDEDSLDRVEGFLMRLDAEIRRTTTQMHQTVREQAIAGARAARDVQDARGAVDNLLGKIVDIKDKTVASERMVAEISTDIRELDTAKKHLSSTIETLSRLQMLFNSIEQLRSQAADREYEGAGQAIEAITQLLTHFHRYEQDPRVKALVERYKACQRIFRDIVRDEFDTMVEQSAAELIDRMHQDTEAAEEAAERGRRRTMVVVGAGDGSGAAAAGQGEAAAGTATERLRAMCEVVDALGGELLSDLVKDFSRKQLRAYRERFRTDQGRKLSKVDGRFIWFRRMLRDVEARFGNVFPAHWKLQRRLAVEFCSMTRDDIAAILDGYTSPDDIDGAEFVQALHKTIAFEREAAERFEKGKGGRRRAGSAAAAGAGSDGSDGSEAGGDDDDDDDEAAGSESESEEEGDVDDGPLVNDRGELVEPKSAEGIRLRYKREQHQAERQAARAQRRKERLARRRWLENLGTGDTRVGAAAAAGLRGLKRLPRFAGLISSCFEHHMGVYVRMERETLEAMLGDANPSQRGDAGKKAREVGDAIAGEAPVLATAPALFRHLNGAVVDRASKLGGSMTVLRVFPVLRDSVKRYVGQLERCLPKPSSTAGPAGRDLVGPTFLVPEDEDEAAELVIQAAHVVNTISYVAEQVARLTEVLQANVDGEEAEERVSLDELEEAAMGSAGNAQKVLGGVLVCAFDRALQAMVSAAWNKPPTGEAVFLQRMQGVVGNLFPALREEMERGYFRQLCNTFVRAFVPRLMSALYKLRKVSVEGAQQMLMEVQQLRQLLCRAPTILPAGAEGEVEEPPSVYIRYLEREMPRIDTLVKLLSTPKEGFEDTLELLW